VRPLRTGQKQSPAGPFDLLPECLRSRAHQAKPPAGDESQAQQHSSNPSRPFFEALYRVAHRNQEQPQNCHCECQYADRSKPHSDRPCGHQGQNHPRRNGCGAKPPGRIHMAHPACCSSSETTEPVSSTSLKSCPSFIPVNPDTTKLSTISVHFKMRPM